MSACQILGNEVYDYGCVGSSKLHHTTYLSVRSAELNLQLETWRFGWNYLHDNHTKNGIHQFDENQSGPLCGSPSATVSINDNVVLHQGGAGIGIGANCPWTNDFDVYNNVLIDVGRAAAWDGVDPVTANGPSTSGISVSDNDTTGTVHVHNNTIFGWNDDDPVADPQACLGLKGTADTVAIEWNDNLCATDKDKQFVAAGCCGAEVQLDNATGSNNSWYYGGSAPVDAVSPARDDATLVQDPRTTVDGPQISVQPNSPLIGRGTDASGHDIYGVSRASGSAIGDVRARKNGPASWPQPSNAPRSRRAVDLYEELEDENAVHEEVIEELGIWIRRAALKEERYDLYLSLPRIEPDESRESVYYYLDGLFCCYVNSVNLVQGSPAWRGSCALSRPTRRWEEGSVGVSLNEKGTPAPGGVTTAPVSISW